MAIKYRADIDGLRAIAVLPVVLFHSGVKLISGGFVGVDIFFVISGYLITSIIYSEITQGRFSIIRFYDRRARRIVPALSVVVLATLIGGWIFLLPSQFETTAKASIATLFFVSNLFFWRETGYFGEAAETQPMLHMWSLSVEEQFYVVFPMLLLLLAKLSKPLMIGVVSLACLCSLTVAEWALGYNPAAAFFLLPPRAWELGVGCLLALDTFPAVRSPRARDAISVGGLAAILVAVFFFSARTRFPGISATLPVLGAAALIYAGPGAAVNRMLAIRPVVGVGLISYSLYLWHWPIIVFLRQFYAKVDLPAHLIVMAIILSFATAALSWRLVERPFRNPGKVSRRTVFAGAGIATAVLALFAVTIALRAGLPSRFAPDVVRMAAASDDFSPLGKKCMDGKWIIRPACEFGPGTGPVTFVIWGDSFAAALVPALQFAAERSGQRGAFIGSNTCPPLDGVVTTRLSARHRAECKKGNADLLGELVNSGDVATVILTGNWATYLSDDSEPMMIDDAFASNNQIAVRAGLQRTVSRLEGAGKRVVILYDLPNPGFNVPWHLALSKSFGRTVPQISAPSAISSMGLLLQQIQGGVRHRLSPTVCDTDRCNSEMNGTVIYVDGGHISSSAAKTLFGPALTPIIFPGGR